MRTELVIIEARKNLGGQMESSARLCLADAIELYDAGNEDAARVRALKSLSYSVGILSPVYQKASANQLPMCLDCGNVNEFGGTVHHYCKGKPKAAGK